MAKDAHEVFGKIHDEGTWRGEVPSGPGSTLTATAIVRPQLTQAFIDFNIRSLCDAPCGDGTWITAITGGLEAYYGLDVVPAVIEANQNKHLARHEFRVADIISDPIPRADAILCRDCLVHLPLAPALEVLKNFQRSGATWLISTTFPGWQSNKEARMGTWRPLDLQLPPFALPEPVRLMRDRAPLLVDPYHMKSLGIWDLAALSL